MKTRVDHLVVGAGAVGLAIAARLAKRGSTVVIDRHPAFGRETSSRNSGVIHAGLHYPADSLKATLCIGGMRLLYEVCGKHTIPHARIGKWIVADSQGLSKLIAIHERACQLGVTTTLLTRNQRLMEPLIKCDEALESPETGIISSHHLMAYFENSIVKDEGIPLYNTEIISCEAICDGFSVVVKTGNEYFTIETPIVINAAGLSSGKVAAMFLNDAQLKGYKLHFAKGNYYSLKSSASLVKRLIYPVPDKHTTSLGVHLTLDLAGRIKFGPDLNYLPEGDDLNYRFTGDSKQFVKAISIYFPSIREEDLIEDYCGIRPKLQGPDDAFRDFHIENHNGFVNLLGIESPGLTSCMAIAALVEERLY